MMGNLNPTLEDLYNVDSEFEKKSFSSKYLPAECVVATDCCEDCCNIFITIYEIKCIRYFFLKKCQTNKQVSVKINRKEFLEKLLEESNSCPVLVAMIIGISIQNLRDLIEMNTEIRQPQHVRAIYKKTADRIGNALGILNRLGDCHPKGGYILPPKFRFGQDKWSDKKTVDQLRVVLDLKVKTRKFDSLVRCNICVGLDTLISRTIGAANIEAKNQLQSHYALISSERALLSSLHQESQRGDSGIILIAMDAMGGNQTKLPVLNSRPKCIGDGVRFSLHVTTAQVSIDSADSSHRNYDVVTPSEAYSSDSSYNLSVLFDCLTKLPSLPPHVFLVLDSASNNKSDVFFAGISILLSHCENIRKISLLYAQVGHTHNAVDAHFGNINKSLEKSDVFTPRDFACHLNEMPSVESVETKLTVYEFDSLKPNVTKFKHRSSNHQIHFWKDSDGKVKWSAREYIDTSGNIGRTTQSEEAYEFFIAGFKPAEFRPSVREAITSKALESAKSLFAKSGNVYSEEQRVQFTEDVTRFGKRAFLQTINQIRQKPTAFTLGDNQYDQQSIIDFLTARGYKTVRKPQKPEKV